MYRGDYRPIFSVIVPIFNIEKYVERCVDSLVNQSYYNLQIILVNDGSTDESGNIVQRYSSDKRVTIINKKNGGLSSARNYGIDKCCGDYVLFVDGDDYIDTRLIEDVYKEVMHYDPDLILFPYSKKNGDKHKNVKLFDDDHIVFDQEEITEKIISRLIGPDLSMGKDTPLNMDRLNTAWGKVYRRSIINDYRFVDTKLIGPEDLWFNLNVIIGCKKAVYIGNHYYVYEKNNQSSILHQFDNQLLIKRFRLYKLIQDYIELHKLEHYRQKLNSRIIAEQFQILLNLSRSKGSLTEKHRETKKILKWQGYKSVYDISYFNGLPLYWKLFFGACKNERDVLVVIIVEMLSCYYNLTLA